MPKVNKIKVWEFSEKRTRRFFPVGIYLLKVNNRNTRARREICSKLTIKTSEQIRHRFGVFIFNFEHLVLVFLLLTLNMELPEIN